MARRWSSVRAITKIQAFPSQRADEPFAERVRLRTLRWRFQHLAAPGCGCAGRAAERRAIAVMNEEAIAMVRWDRFAQLLERPGGGGMRRHIAWRMRRVACSITHKDVEQAKGGGDHHAEVTCHDGLGMIADKCLPALGRHTWPGPWSRRFGMYLRTVRGDTRRPSFSKQLIGNALLAPCGVIPGHLTDERLQVRRNARSSRVDFQRQNSRNPSRCQRVKVSGCTTAKACRQSNHRRARSGRDGSRSSHARV